jgi:hypothetical protein
MDVQLGRDMSTIWQLKLVYGFWDKLLGMEKLSWFAPLVYHSMKKQWRNYKVFIHSSCNGGGVGVHV